MERCGDERRQGDPAARSDDPRHANTNQPTHRTEEEEQTTTTQPPLHTNHLRTLSSLSIHTPSSPTLFSLLSSLYPLISPSHHFNPPPPLPPPSHSTHFRSIYLPASFSIFPILFSLYLESRIRSKGHPSGSQVASFRRQRTWNYASG